MAHLSCDDATECKDIRRARFGKEEMMEYRTADGHILDDALLEQEADAFERGIRPDGWRMSESRPVSVTLPGWVIAEADAEAARVNISRRAVLNMWLAEKAEQSERHRRELAMA